VDLIVTDLAVIDVKPEGLVLREVAPGWTADEVQKVTGAPLLAASRVAEITLVWNVPGGTK
jgi:acyl CoA:acetate/3-ketoacid CoA transferase beta subunit